MIVYQFNLPLCCMHQAGCTYLVYLPCYSMGIFVDFVDCFIGKYVSGFSCIFKMLLYVLSGLLTVIGRQVIPDIYTLAYSFIYLLFQYIRKYL